MKQILWVSALAMMATVCLTACSNGSNDSSYEIPSYKNVDALPDSCAMEVVKVDTAYYACFENKWVEVTDSASVEQLKDGLDEKEIKSKLEELEDVLAKSSSSSKESANSSDAAEGEAKEDGDKAESSSSVAEDSGSSVESSASSENGSSISEEVSSSSVESSSSAEISSSDAESSSSVEISSSSVESSSSEEISSSSEESSSSSEEEVIDCTGKTAKHGKQTMSVTVDGKKRTFIMLIPEAYDGTKAVPLVVDYHPVMGSGQGQYNATNYKKLTEPEGVISLYPDGTKSADSRKTGPGWNVGPCCSDDDDVKFTREMIAAVEEVACINPKRVYATGFSMGGGMANHVACFMADVFAAVAPAAMDLNKTNSAKCTPDRPISIIMFRGTHDGTCRYQGGDSGYNDGLNFLGAEGNFRFWATKNECVGEPITNSDGCKEYSDCKDGTKVVLCAKEGGGHEQGDGSVGWPFLKQFTLP